MDAARQSFAALDEPWQVAVSEAWTSWAAGSAGVGAVITAADGGILAVGRNRIAERRREPGVLASTMLAHAEMNALALLRIGPSEGLTISTTYEPCLMCASAIVQFSIPRVRYASADPVFHGVHDGLTTLPFARDRIPERELLGGRIGAFAHVLHVSWLAYWQGDGPIVDAHRTLRPAHLRLAQAIAATGELATIAQDGGDVVTALDALWDELEALDDHA